MLVYGCANKMTTGNQGVDMKIIKTKIPDVKLIEIKVFGDERGFFMETYQRQRYTEEAGISEEFVQDNHSGSRQGTLRGLHYQVKKPQGKLVRAIAGKIFDVAVDIRSDSATFGGWMGTILDAEERKQLWIPPGFAHGFYVMSDWAEVEYKTTALYAPELERTILWNDEELAIEWPINTGESPIVSAKDSNGLRFRDAELY